MLVANFTNTLGGTARLSMAGTSPAFSIIDILPIAKDLFRIQFDTEVLTNTTYFDKSTYTVTEVGGTLDLVRRVAYTQADTAIDHVDIHTISTTPGMRLVFGVRQLLTPSGATNHQIATMSTVVEPTKTDAALRSMPPMYYKAIDSRIRALMTAITLEDQLIGGASRELT